MKRRSFYSTLFALLLALVLTACGKDGGPINPMGDTNDPSDSGDGNVPAELVTTWTFQSLSIGDTQLDLGEFMEWEEETASAQIKIAADGSVTYTELDENKAVVCSLIGTMSVDGDKFSYVIKDEFEGQNIEKESCGTWAVNGNQLSMTMIQEGMPVVFTLTK